MARIINREGWLCIQDDWQPRSMEPIRTAPIYPVGLRASDFSHFIGMEARYTGTDGVYLATNGAKIRLTDGGQTRPVETLEEPLASPRGGPWRYSWGEWVNSKTGKRRPAL